MKAGGCIRLTTNPARPVHQHRRVAVAVFHHRPTNHHDRPPATADAAQLSASSINTTRGAAASLLRTGPPGRRAAAAVPSLRRALPSAGAVNTFLSFRDRRENRQGIHTPPQGSLDTGGYGACRCAGVAPLRKRHLSAHRRRLSGGGRVR